MSSQLSLDNIRSVLIRLEETIIFGLIERAQFRQNLAIYRRGEMWRELEGESLVGFLLHESEKSHAKVRRYTSPDEHPFFADLPKPILPAIEYENPLKPNSVNINGRVRASYEWENIPFICESGDDRQWGSSSVCDVANLQNLSKRIHYGKFVAESKYLSQQGRFQSLVRQGDAAALMAAITDEAVEQQVLDRVHRKTVTYAAEFESSSCGHKINPDAVREIYRRWVIPLNKEVQVQYLLERGI